MFYFIIPANNKDTDQTAHVQAVMRIIVSIGLKHMSCVMRKPAFWFPTLSDTDQAVQLQKMTRGLKFRIYEVEGLYYICNKNKGADQLRGYREADLRLCFCICKMLVSHDTAHFSLCSSYPYLSHVMRKPAFCIRKNKGADQLHS